MSDVVGGRAFLKVFINFTRFVLVGGCNLD